MKAPLVFAISVAVVAACAGSKKPKQLVVDNKAPCPWKIDWDSVRTLRDSLRKARADSLKKIRRTAADSAKSEREADSLAAAAVKQAVNRFAEADTGARADTTIGNPRFNPSCDYAGGTLTVTNDNWSDMRIYLVRGEGSRIRLGEITSLSSKVFEIPKGMLGTHGLVYFVASPVGGPYDYSTEYASVQPGHMYFDLRIDSNINHSSFSVDVEFRPEPPKN